MALITDNLDLARSAYAALEGRAASADRRSAVLQAQLAALLRKPPPASEITALRNRVAALEGENIQLRNQLDQLLHMRSDALLEKIIQGLGLAIALGEASMPDRTIGRVAVTLTSHVVPDAAGFGIRFQPPELGALATGLSTTSFDLSKVPPATGGATPRNLYIVLEDKQRIYTNAFWSASAPALNIVVEIAKILADTGAWSFPFLAQQAVLLATGESALADALPATVRPEIAASYRAQVHALQNLAGALVSKADPVAGDLYTLSAALDNTNRAAKDCLLP